MSVEAGKRPPQTRSTAKDTEFRRVFDLILIETGENSLRFLGRYEIRHLCRASLGAEIATAHRLSIMYFQLTENPANVKNNDEHGSKEQH